MTVRKREARPGARRPFRPALRALFVAALGLVASGAVGCAQERAPINRVQANALAKSFFVGNDLVSTQDDPEFWTQGTLIDVGYGAAQDGLFTSTYAQPVSRIKWQITEDMLIGRITYERINDTDGKGKGPTDNDGVIAVAYPIISHFDIRRSYNTATGEELNVVEENTVDRPWYEREYFRVDWSRSLATDAYDFDTLSLMGIYGSIDYEPMAYYVNDPADPDAPVFDVENGYFDVTNKAFAKPKLIDLSSFGWGIDSFPACYLDPDFMNGTGPGASCNPVELTIRQSFRRVVDTDFEPQEWDGFRFQAYGAFMVERLGYCRNYGLCDDKWHRMITRYNLWERSHYYSDPNGMTGEVACNTEATTPYGSDPNRDEDGDGTADECASVTGSSGFGGSQCDTFKQKCTLPFRARTAKPITWYYSNDSNQDYYDGTRWATHEWDVALRAAVQTAKYAECTRIGDEDCSQYPVYNGQQIHNEDAIRIAREVDDCREGLPGARTGNCESIADQLGGDTHPAVVELAKMPEMLVLCHSPVQAGDPPACGDRRLPDDLDAQKCEDARRDLDHDTMARCNEALNVRMGDLRYHQVNVMRAPQTPSPWGIYTDSEDPLTGEKIAASINVWSHVADLWSQGVVDQVRYIKGELQTSDVTEGTYVRDWAKASEAAAGFTGVRLSRAELERQARSIAGAKSGSFGGSDAEKLEMKGQLPAEVLAKAKQLKGELSNVKASLDGESVMRPIYAQRRAAAMGTQTEAELMTPAMQQLSGVTELPLDGEVMNYASPLRGLNPSVQRELRMLKQNAMAERGFCMMEAPAPNSMTGLADILQEKFGAFDPTQSKGEQHARAERMRRYIAQRAHYSVIIHEMGHSVGLRHNFVSSSDAWGFRPQYWQLRTKDGSVTQVCDDADPTGEDCVGPRYYDPMTESERSQLIWMFMHHSVMEYAGENTQDLLGLGTYDFAAARMFYADAVAVHADPSYNVLTARGRGMIEKMDNFGGILGMQPVIGTANGQDSNNIHYSQINNEYQVIQNCAPIDPTSQRPSTWNDERDGTWHPTIDGFIVKGDGQNYSRCQQQPVDYVKWDSLRRPNTEEGEAPAFVRGGPMIDPQGRTRVPYGFATDRWADLGNLSVYRHDNGADPYELFNFFIAQQEIGHIFDYYRRNRNGFSVRVATGRNLWRFNEKMRDGAKGLGLLANIYRDFFLEIGFDFDTAWAQMASQPTFFRENLLASGIAFDHFVRMAARPQAGPHFRVNAGDLVLRSNDSTLGQPGTTRVIVPNGATGYFGDVGWGGKLLENRLAETKGEYDAEFTVNAGAYYDKVWVPMLLTESVDNFISDSLGDFHDARYRSVSMADLFPDGYRRWLGNALTGDDELKGPRIAAQANGNPITDDDDYPALAIGWTSWWKPTGPESCFPLDGSITCGIYSAGTNGDFDSQAPANTVVLDPQIGWEQQKFLIAMTLMYLPENQKQYWLDLMQIYELGVDNDPGFENRIEFHHPGGKVFVARTYGTEVIFGKTVQKGIGARILEYANQLVEQAYEVTPVTQNGVTWYVPVIGPTGAPIVKYDPSVVFVTSPTGAGAATIPGCSPTENYACTCTSNRACVELGDYVSVPLFMRQAFQDLEMTAKQKGVY